MNKKELIQSVLGSYGLKGAVMTYGNKKLPKSTLIFNHSTATNCPSAEFCECRTQCYAKRDEGRYKAYKARNERNEIWFKSASIDELKAIFKLFIETASRNHPIKTLRLNEAGDFTNQEAIEKFNTIAKWLKKEYNIVTYAYSCRIDLDFSGKTFILNASRPEINNYNRIFKCTKTDQFKALKSTDLKCIGDCKRCNICSTEKTKKTVYCLEH